MIELLNARRMVFVIGLLILLCIIIVILEDTITDHVDKPTPYLEHLRRHHNQSADQKHPSASSLPVLAGNLSHPSSIQLGSQCWQHEPFTVLSKCGPCSVKERLLPACIDTGYKEHLHCALSGDVFRTCDSVTSLFWVFHFFMLCLSVVFNFYVKKRQSYLNRLVLERIEKQISSGV